jgi:chromosomal replication initiator protein
MYLAKTLTLRSLPAIGRLFDRDNTTVLHAVRKIEGLLKQDSQLAADIAGIQRRIGTPMQEAA